MKITKKQENKIFDLLFNEVSTKRLNKDEYFIFLDGVINTIYILNNYTDTDFIKRLQLMANQYK